MDTVLCDLLHTNMRGKKRIFIELLNYHSTYFEPQLAYSNETRSLIQYKTNNLLKAISAFVKYTLLGSKELGTNVLELHFVMLTNHDQKVLVLFRLAQSICFFCKVGIELLQDLLCKSAWFDQLRIKLDRSKLG